MAITPEGYALLNTISGPESNGDYNVLYGGGRFNGFSDHPRQLIPIQSGPNAGQKSSAAGKYQFLAGTWDEAKRALNLPDFSPQSQDEAAWWLAQRDYKSRTGRNLQRDLQSGNPQTLNNIARNLSPTWTSLPSGIEQGISGSAFQQAYSQNLQSPNSALAAINQQTGNLSPANAANRLAYRPPQPQPQLSRAPQLSPRNDIAQTVNGLTQDSATQNGLADYLSGRAGGPQQQSGPPIPYPRPFADKITALDNAMMLRDNPPPAVQTASRFPARPQLPVPQPQTANQRVNIMQDPATMAGNVPMSGAGFDRLSAQFAANPIMAFSPSPIPTQAPPATRPPFGQYGPQLPPVSRPPLQRRNEMMAEAGMDVPRMVPGPAPGKTDRLMPPPMPMPRLNRAPSLPPMPQAPLVNTGARMQPVQAPPVPAPRIDRQGGMSWLPQTGILGLIRNIDHAVANASGTTPNNFDNLLQNIFNPSGRSTQSTWRRVRRPRPPGGRNTWGGNGPGYSE